MRSFRTTLTADVPRHRMLRRVPAAALGACFVGSMLISSAAMAQTTTTVLSATSTTALPVDTTTLDNAVTADSSAAAVAATDTAVPTGGVDAGFGGTAPADGSVPLVPVAVGVVLVGGFVALRMAKVRRTR